MKYNGSKNRLLRFLWWTNYMIANKHFFKIKYIKHFCPAISCYLSANTYTDADMIGQNFFLRYNKKGLNT